MDLSVVVVTRDTREMTRAALASVREAAGRLSHETVLVDNGSSDGTAEALGAAFPGLRVIRNGRNLGFARAANQGWREGSGEFVLFLNSDARLPPGGAEALVRFLQEAPRRGLAGAQLLDPDGRTQNSVDNVPTLATELLNKSLLKRLFPGRFPGTRGVSGAAVEVPTLVGACFAARRACLNEVGGFDEGFFFFLEETDLCVRARSAGWSVHLVPSVRAIHLQGQTARRVRTPARVEYYRSRYRFFRKHRGELAAGVLAAGLVARLAAETLLQGIANLLTLGLSSGLRGRWRTTAGILAWHLRGCPADGGLAGASR